MWSPYRINIDECFKKVLFSHTSNKYTFFPFPFSQLHLEFQPWNTSISRVGPSACRRNIRNVTHHLMQGALTRSDQPTSHHCRQLSGNIFPQRGKRDCLFSKASILYINPQLYQENDHNKRRSRKSLHGSNSGTGTAYTEQHRNQPFLLWYSLWEQAGAVR